jgi:hypothetical protein
MIEPLDTQPQFEGISPVFPVSNVAAAPAFYRERLGFDLGWIWGDPPTHANVCRGAIAISLTLKQTEAGTGQAYVELRGIDAYYADLRTRTTQIGVDRSGS